MSDRLDAAISYACSGLRVVPVGCNKVPYFKGWNQKATTDPEQISSWWTRYPDANIVTLTGREAGFFVLDVDRRNGGDVSLAAIEESNGVLPATLRAKTGDGFHIYLKTPSFLVRSTEIAPGVEVKAERAAVTLPPSVHRNGAVYTWVDGHREIAAAPSWLLEQLRPVTRHLATAPAAHVVGDAYGKAAVQRELARVRAAAEGARNVTLNRASFNLGQLVGASALSEQDVESALFNGALACGLGETESRATIRSGLRAGIAAPRAAVGRRPS